MTGNFDARNLELYRKICLVRRAEEGIVRHYGEDEMKSPMHMSMGQEAGPAAISVSLGDRAQLFTTYRSHAPFLSQTDDVNRFFAEMYGRVDGTAEGKSGSMHLAILEKGHLCSTAIVGAGMAPAVGAAFASKYQKSGKIAVPMFGDGATEEGTFWESLNVASVMKLPIIFMLEDNEYAVHTRPDVRRGFKSFEAVAQAFDMPYLRFDDNDPLTGLQTVDKARDMIDARMGPVFLHVVCYRYLEHVGINTDFHTGYRGEDEYHRWRARDCIDMQRKRLVAAGHETEVLAIEKLIDERVAAAIAAAKKSPFPAPERLLKGVFHEAH
jgi:TPP-dependent pyruvate/acetoin dehydrogenase alpha subunit